MGLVTIKKHSALLVAYLANQKVEIWFSDNTDPSDCNDGTLVILDSVLIK